MPFANPHLLVDTTWLSTHLHDPGLRIIEAAVDPAPGLELIPGATLVDMRGDLGDPRLPFATLPSAERFEEVMSEHGVGEGSRVVCYDRSANLWSARLWWMLRFFGFDHAAVLDGGYGAWAREGRPVSEAAATPEKATFVARPRSELAASLDEVREAMVSGSACLLNSLPEPLFRGTAPTAVARPGHIPGSVNVPHASLLDPETLAYRSSEELETAFAQAGVLEAPRVVTYCLAGNAASHEAFVLALLGVDDVSVYNGSLLEWAADPRLPLETG